MNGKRPPLLAEKGFSVTELLIAVVVSLVLMAGVIQLLIANKQAYRLQEGTSILNENARFVTQRVQHDVRMGSNWAGAGKDDVKAHTDVTGLGDCPLSLAMALDKTSDPLGIQGIQGAGTPPVPMDKCIPNENYVANSDIVVIRYAETDAVPPADPDTTNGSVCDWVGAGDCRNDLFLRSAVGFNAVVAQGKNLGTAASAYAFLKVNGTTDPPGTGNYRYRAYALYVRPCQRLPTVTPPLVAKCDPTLDDTPTLVRVALDGVTPVHEDLVAGVEQMQALYGVDSDNDGNAERYFAANSVTDWNRVVSMRINLLLRDLEKDVSYTSPATFGMLDSFTYTVPTGARDYRRKQLITVVQIRNLSRS